MLVVALDTTTRPGSHAIVRDGVPVIVQAGDPSRAHAERLPGDVLAALAASGASLPDVDLCAVAAGPGSFTGLRIGIAAMQGLAFAAGKPIVGVSALDALAATALLAMPEAGTIAAWIDAQRGEVFAALYRVGSGGLGPVFEPMDEALVAPPAEVIERWRARGVRAVQFAGDGALRFRPLVDACPDLASGIVDPLPPLAPAVARLAAERHARGGVFLPHGVEPIYVRRPDAELARDRRGPGA